MKVQTFGNFSIFLHDILRYNDAIHLRDIEPCLSAHFRVDPPGAGELHTLPESRSSVPFGVAASPVPHG
jgi:hypothetical protein